MIALSEAEERTRRGSIETRGATGEQPHLYAETDDLPFLFEAYRIEAPIRSWLERLYVTGFAHGARLRTDIADARHEANTLQTDAAIESCLLRNWLRPVAYKPREASALNMGANRVSWCAWSFEPANDVRAWLEGGMLSALGDPDRQAAYDGETRGMRFRAAEQRAYERDLDEAVHGELWAVREMVDGGLIPPDADEDGCIDLTDLLARVRRLPRWRDVTLIDVDQSWQRLQRGQKATLCDVE
jgi:hypothetical protein